MFSLSWDEDMILTLEHPLVGCLCYCKRRRAYGVIVAITGTDSDCAWAYWDILEREAVVAFESLTPTTALPRSIGGELSLSDTSDLKIIRRVVNYSTGLVNAEKFKGLVLWDKPQEGYYL